MPTPPVDNNDLSPNGTGGGNALKDFQLDASVKTKSSKKFGEKIVLQCEQIITSGYFSNRNKRFSINRAMAAGKMDTTKFMDFFNMNAKTNYVNINWKYIMIVATVISRLVGRWITRRVKATVTAIDPVSIKQKKSMIDQAEFILDNKGVISELENASGSKLIADDEFVPDDKDHLDFWAEEELRVPEEILNEKGINNVFQENGLYDVIERKLLHDSATVGLIGTETIADRHGRILVNYCKPENMFYSYSEYDDFRDAAILGEIVSYKINQIRDLYPSLTVEQLYEIAKLSKQWQNSDKIAFDTGWNNNTFLPFDDWNVDVVRFTLRALDIDRNLIKKGLDGRMYVDKPKKRIDEVYPGNEYVENTIWNIYRGVYVRQNKFILEWGLEKNMIKPQNYEQISEAYHPYSFFMYQNDQMRNLAIPEKIEEPVEMMILTRLRIQQFIAKMRPNGLMYDIDGLQNMDLGNGIATPLELERVTDQTGNVYFRSRDAEGNRLERPITESPNSAGISKLQELIEVYNFHLQVMRDEIGSNEFAEGQTIKPRVGAQNVQTSLEVSFNATDYMRDATISLMQLTANKVVCLLHDAVEFGSSEYRKIMQEKDVKDREFKVKIEMLPTVDDITNLENMVNTAMMAQPNLVYYINPEKIKRIARENTQLAEQYFRIGQKRALEGEAAKAKQASDLNAQNQIASAKAAAEGEAKIKQIEQRGKLTQAEQKFVQDAMLLQMDPVNQTPPWVQQMIDIYLEEIKAQKEQERMQKEQQAAMQEVAA